MAHGGAREFALGGLSGVIDCMVFVALAVVSTRPADPVKCPAPWKLTDKTVLPSAFDGLIKDHDIKTWGGVPSGFIEEKVVLVMSCEPLGLYRIETETNP
jgi:hypothetical protein